MKNANRRKYHYIYKTTCLVTGKYYIGMHSTDDLNDGYLGSGKRLWYSINKHGKENHVCEILEHYFTRQFLREREAELVNPEMLTDPMCMNLKVGGNGGWDHISLTKEERIKLAKHASSCGIEARRAYMESGKHSETMRSWMQERWGNDREKMLKYTESGRKALSSESAIEKRKIKFREIGHQSGVTNSQFGTKWMVSETGVAKKVKFNEVPTYLENGWILGRTR